MQRCARLPAAYRRAAGCVPPTTIRDPAGRIGVTMPFSIYAERGVPLERQRFTWRELAPKPISKLDDDAFTRVRIILMNGIEMEALRFQHFAARIDDRWRRPLAEIR